MTVIRAADGGTSKEGERWARILARGFEVSAARRVTTPMMRGALFEAMRYLMRHAYVAARISQV